ncbi:MAG: hypothetical protein M1824_003848 [Vezdaea acicularis]|nr:MAG: hypothetical protein M1824_003848 [Vezdaea acicularis]
MKFPVFQKALAHHPDKVPEADREESEIKFKAVSQAHEILHDDQKRHLYDTHGMAAFDPAKGNGMGPEVDMNDILQQMFNMGSGPGGGGPRKPRKGKDDEQRYEVSLEDLYRGKTTKFAVTKRVICSLCKGTGGKERAKPKECSVCQGKGFKTALRPVGPGMVTQTTVECSNCHGSGHVYKDKERCKKCKGERTTEERKALELYIPRGAREGERIVLPGEADQNPDQEPGDIVFHLVEIEHPLFTRAGADLTAPLKVTLAEALCGFSRTVLIHLDGRGIHITHPQGKILKPGQTLKVIGEGMPHKKSDAKGDLYLIVDMEFPKDGWIKDDSSALQLQSLLPKPADPIHADTVDEVEYDPNGNIEEFGHGHPGGGSQWVDEDDDVEGEGPQCAQQ